MLISSMGRYAVLVLLDLAEHRGGFVPARQIAERQELSQKYLERILRTLTEQGLVEGTHGKGGGYRLNRPPEEYTIGSILKLTEGSLSAVSCTSMGASACSRTECCQAKPMWDKLDRMIDGFFEGITLADLLHDSVTA